LQLTPACGTRDEPEWAGEDEDSCPLHAGGRLTCYRASEDGAEVDFARQVHGCDTEDGAELSEYATNAQP
jgi:hypothetical protein